MATRISAVKLYTLKSGVGGDRGAAEGESQYWGGGELMRAPVASAMSLFPEHRASRRSWAGPGQDPFVVELETDEGFTGFAANYGGGRYACDVIDTHFRRFLEGHDPFNIERMWEVMFRSTSTYGQGGITSMAMSGVDLALWDLIGKITNQPVYNLLGGKTKESIPCYVTVHLLNTLKDMAQRGFMGCKLVSQWGCESGRAGLDKIESEVGAARDLFGHDAEIMLECYQSMDKEYAVRVAERLKKFDLKWLEDPLMSGHAFEQNREIRGAIKPIQLAIGNLEYDYRAFHQILAHSACDILQPEIQWVGGMTAAKRISAMAKPHGVPVIPHGASVYNYHFVVSETNSPYAEFVVTGDGTEIRPIFDAILGEPLPQNGHVRLSDRPGFGVDLNRDILESFGSRKTVEEK